MSTKTTLKRVALVAVSALGFGLLSVMPAKAAVLTAAAATATPSAIEVAATSTVTSRVAMNGAAGDTLAFTWDATGVTDATDYAWKILEHSASVSSNVYQGAVSTGFTMTWASTDANAYVLVQFLVTGAATADTLLLLSGSDTGTEVTIDIANTAGTATTFPSTIANATDTPWRIDEGFATSTSKANLASLTGSEVVTSTTNDVRIYAEIDDTVKKAGDGSYRYVEVTGSTIKAVAGGVVIDGLANTATRALVVASGDISDGTSNLDAGDAQIWVNAGTTGTITLKFYDRSKVALTGAFFDTLLQTVTFTITAPGAISPQTSVAYIHALQGSAATTGVATSQAGYVAYAADFAAYDCSPATGTQACDFSIIAPFTADPATPKAVIQVQLKDADGVDLVGTLPAVGASIAGAGTLSISSATAGPGGVASEGRSLAKTAAPSSTFYINVFSDGTAGTGTISILVGGSVWKTKTIKFYSALSKVEAVAGLSVLKSGTTSGCVTSLAVCDGETVAGSVATTLLATDANGTPVPFVTYKQVSSDATILVGNATAVAGQPTTGQNAHYLGASWFQVTTMPSVDSGKSATMTYTTALTATTTLSSNALTFKIGGAPTAAKLTVASGKSVGEKGTMTINVTDASGNAIYDSDHTVAFTTNIALASGTGLLSGAGAIDVRDGKTTIDFFNPVVPGTVTVSGLVSDALPIAGSFTVTNASQDAATDAALGANKAVQDAIEAATSAADAALEAIDAANAATDAANLAAEAADAATVAAEEARDAADAATAAVEALATEVAALIASLKAQITTLANTVAKIAKKVKA